MPFSRIYSATKVWINVQNVWTNELYLLAMLSVANARWTCGCIWRRRPHAAGTCISTIGKYLCTWTWISIHREGQRGSFVDSARVAQPLNFAYTPALRRISFIQLTFHARRRSRNHDEFVNNFDIDGWWIRLLIVCLLFSSVMFAGRVLPSANLHEWVILLDCSRLCAKHTAAAKQVELINKLNANFVKQHSRFPEMLDDPLNRWYRSQRPRHTCSPLDHVPASRSIPFRNSRTEQPLLFIQPIEFGLQLTSTTVYNLYIAASQTPGLVEKFSERTVLSACNCDQPFGLTHFAHVSTAS